MIRWLTPKDIGAMVREARLNSGFTQSQLGEKIGASRFWVADFERGKAGVEFGLALRALRALRLVLTIEPKEIVTHRQEEEARNASDIRSHEPAVDLSSILRRSAASTDNYLTNEELLAYTSPRYEIFNGPQISEPQKARTKSKPQKRKRRQ